MVLAAHVPVRAQHRLWLQEAVDVQNIHGQGLNQWCAFTSHAVHHTPCSDRSLPTELANTVDMTVELCQELAIQGGYELFGLQSSTYCLAGRNNGLAASNKSLYASLSPLA